MRSIKDENLKNLLLEHPELDFTSAKNLKIAFSGEYSSLDSPNETKPYKRIYAKL
jgi:hypothetical protein